MCAYVSRAWAYVCGVASHVATYSTTVCFLCVLVVKKNMLFLCVNLVKLYVSFQKHFSDLVFDFSHISCSLTFSLTFISPKESLTPKNHGDSLNLWFVFYLHSLAGLQKIGNHDENPI